MLCNANASNTWEFKTLTFPADTSGGEIPHDNGKGLRVDFVLPLYNTPRTYVLPLGLVFLSGRKLGQVCWVEIGFRFQIYPQYSTP